MARDDTQYFLGEIRPDSHDQVPPGWARCQGQLLPIAENQDLYRLLGTTYGGDGLNNFGLPDLSRRVPVGTGPLAGTGTLYQLGQRGGTEAVSLQQAHLPAHQHPLAGTLQASKDSDNNVPQGLLPSVGTLGQYSAGPADTEMGARAQGTASLTGNGMPHENRPPFIALNYLIALQGLFPTPAS